MSMPKVTFHMDNPLLQLRNLQHETHLPFSEICKYEYACCSLVDKCGGVIHGASGRLSYKLDSLYENGERCIWLIHSQASSEIQLKLVKEGFELCCDYVLVNTVDTSTGQMNNLTITLTYVEFASCYLHRLMHSKYVQLRKFANLWFRYMYIHYLDEKIIPEFSQEIW